MIPTIIVHGGAGWIRDQVWADYQRGTQLAAQLGQTVLNLGGSALEAAVQAVVALENDPTFNAGRGSSLNLNGEVQCDAFVMTDELLSGGVAAISGVRNAVLLARAVLEHTPHELLAGPGALELAERAGVELCDPDDLIVERRRRQWDELRAQGASFEKSIFLESSTEPTPESSDTVGACAIDRDGRIAVASSTGGIMLKLPGRVGDTPLIGAGSYCGPGGAVTCTGHGEACMRIVLAKYIYDGLEQGASVLEAARQGVEHMVRLVDGKAGVIVLDRHGNRAWATSTSRIAVGIPEEALDSPEGAL